MRSNLSTKIFILLPIILSFWTSACGGLRPPSRPKIGVSVATMQEAVYSFMKQAMLDRKDSDQIEIIWVSAENSESKQASDVERLLDQGIDALILHAVNTSTAQVMVQKSSAAGVPVIAMDRLPAGVAVDLYVTADSRKVGRLQAEFLAEKIQGRGKTARGNIVILEGETGNSVAREITEGNVEALKNHPDLNIVLRQPHKNWARDLAMITTRDALAKHGRQIHGILANNSGMAMGALQVVRENHLSRPIFIVGSDADRDACEALAEGALSADVDKMPYELGLAAYQAACRLIRKEPLNADSRMTSGGVSVSVKLTPVKLITKENVKSEMEYRWGKL